MTYLVAFIVCFIAGIGAGLGTGFAGMSAAAVISPMLITFLGMDPYMAVGIALASDVLASAISAYTYGKSGNLDIKNGAVMMASVLCFTLVGSYVASLVPGTTMGGFSTFMTLLLGVKFIVRPVMTTKSAMNAVSVQKRFAQSLLCGAGVGFIWALRPMPCRWSRYWRTSSAAAWSLCLRALRRRSSRRCRTICAAWMKTSCGS